VFCLALALLRAVRFSFALEDGRALFSAAVLVILCVRSFSETTFTDPVINGWAWLVIAFLTVSHMRKEKVPLPSPYRVTPVEGQKA
jgi:uncharacterized membrane protein YjgN (DUF898 family)